MRWPEHHLIYLIREIGYLCHICCSKVFHVGERSPPDSSFMKDNLLWGLLWLMPIDLKSQWRSIHV